MKDFLVVVICIYSALQLTVAEPVCHMSEVGTCLDHVIDYINTLPKRTVPETTEELSKLCKSLDDLIACWNDYTKRCMSPLQGEVEVLLSEGAKDLQKRFCAPGSDLGTNFLKHSKCLSGALKVDKATDNINRVLALFEKFNTVPDTKKVTYGCCGWNQMYHAVMDVVVDKCDEDAKQSLEELIELGVSELPQVLCSGFDPKSDRCQKVLLPEGTLPTGRSNNFVDAIRYVFKNHLD